MTDDEVRLRVSPTVILSDVMDGWPINLAWIGIGETICRVSSDNFCGRLFEEVCRDDE